MALKDKIPTLSRSNLHRCLRRNGLSRPAPEEADKKEQRKKFESYEIGFLHLDIAQIHTAEWKAYLFVAIDRKTRFVFAELYFCMNVATTVTFLQNVIAKSPFKIHTIITDNGAQFTYKLLMKHLVPDNKIHPFDAVCEKHGIQHRLTEFRHPWTNGLVKRMNRTIKDEIVNIYFYETLPDLQKHLAFLLLAYNHQRKLKSLYFASLSTPSVRNLRKTLAAFTKTHSSSLRNLTMANVFYLLETNFLASHFHQIPIL